MLVVFEKFIKKRLLERKKKGTS